VKHTVFIGLVAIASFLFSESSHGSKMQPGLMAHSNVHGLNANTSCRRPRLNICQGCDVNIRMRVIENGQCGFNFQSLGPFVGQEVLVSPRNGTYSLVNETTAIYRPNPSYAGRDHFEARLFFEEGNGKRTFLNMKVNVLVSPNLTDPVPHP
jgi:hypothetical protein